MIYKEFTSEVLKRFPKFRHYYIEDYNANEIDLLPSNIAYDFYEYMNNTVIDNEDELEGLVGLLDDMKSSNDEYLIMLYNEGLKDISSMSNLYNRLKSVKAFNVIIPYKIDSTDSIKQHINTKKIFTESLTKDYEAENKKLIKTYKDKNGNIPS
jgi:hypothetical protein